MPDDKTRIVKVVITTKDGKDDGTVPTFVEVDRGAGHVRVSGKDLITNKSDETFELKPGERLVIEGYTAEAVAYSREQAAAYRPDNQVSGSNIDAPRPPNAQPEKKDEQTSASGAKPSETQDSRLKSSPGTTVTPAMANTPSANTGAAASKPNMANVSSGPQTKSNEGTIPGEKSSKK